MTRADIIVVAFTLALLPFLYGTFWNRQGPADTALIIDESGREFGVPLDTNQQLRIDGPLGVSVLEIADGRIRFLDSPCRGKQCIHSGWLDESGEFAACLPNRVSVAVSGSEPLYDSINF